MQIPYCVVSEVSVSSIAGRESEVCGGEREDVVWVERVGSGGVECSKRSCACDIGNTAEVFGVRSDGNVEGEDDDQDVPEFSGDEKEAVLGESFLGERILCEHDWAG